jgi:hypothetical protein
MSNAHAADPEPKENTNAKLNDPGKDGTGSPSAHNSALAR